MLFYLTRLRKTLAHFTRFNDGLERGGDDGGSGGSVRSSPSAAGLSGTSCMILLSVPSACRCAAGETLGAGSPNGGVSGFSSGDDSAAGVDPAVLAGEVIGKAMP